MIACVQTILKAGTMMLVCWYLPVSPSTVTHIFMAAAVVAKAIPVIQETGALLSPVVLPLLEKMKKECAKSRPS